MFTYLVELLERSGMAPMHNKDLKVEHMLEVVLGNNCHRQVDHKVEAVLDDFLKL